MATAEFLEIISISATSQTHVYQVILDEDETLLEGAEAVRAVAPEFTTTVSIGADDATLVLTNIRADKDKECDWIRYYTEYSKYQPDTGPSSGTWPNDVDTTISVQVSSQTDTSHNVYLTGGTVTNPGTFNDFTKGYSETGFPIFAPQVILTVRKRYTTLPAGWATTLADKVGKINNATLFGAPIGSLMYMGAQTNDYPEDGSAGETELTHQYSYIAPTSSFVVNGMTIAGKKGWELYDFKTSPHGRGRTTTDWQILKPYQEADLTP